MHATRRCVGSALGTREEGSKWRRVVSETKLQAAGARENAPELFQHQAPARVNAQLAVNVMRSGLALQLKVGSQTRDVEQRRLRIISLPQLCPSLPA